MRLDVRVEGGKGRVPSEIGTEPDRVGIRAMESRPLKWTTMGLLTIVLLSGVTCYWLLLVRVTNGGLTFENELHRGIHQLVEDFAEAFRIT